MCTTRLFALGLFTIAICSGCNASKIQLYVDNDSESSYRVEIVGVKNLYVGAGKSAKWRVPFGTHRIIVRKNKKVIFDETKDFQLHKNGPGWRHYLLDPEANTRYTVREFFYYSDQEEAKKGKTSRHVKRLSPRHWIDVPKSATALFPVTLTWASKSEDESTRLCVVRHPSY